MKAWRQLPNFCLSCVHRQVQDVWFPLIKIVLKYKCKAWLKPHFSTAPHKYSLSRLDITHIEHGVFWYQRYWKRTSKMKKKLKSFYFYICILKYRCNQHKAFKNNCKRLKKYNHIHIHKYRVAVHSRKILWRNNLGEWDLSEGHSSQFGFLVSLTEIRYCLLEDKEIHLSARADLLPRLKKKLN